MSDALDRLFRAVMAAKDLDPERSRTARLFRRGQPKMAKKLAEEAIEVAIDAVSGNSEAVVRESADLLYNLMVVWVAAGVRPEDVWAEMDRRERMLGIAEKLPKASGKAVAKHVSKPFGSRRKAATQARSGRSRMAADGRGQKRRQR
jgi:phosphoribosyl-ATP pyrophosphohydrolase